MGTDGVSLIQRRPKLLPRNACLEIDGDNATDTA
jgi:hypothetical protein